MASTPPKTDEPASSSSSATTTAVVGGLLLVGAAAANVFGARRFMSTFQRTAANAEVRVAAKEAM